MNKPTSTNLPCNAFHRSMMIGLSPACASASPANNPAGPVPTTTGRFLFGLAGTAEILYTNCSTYFALCLIKFGFVRLIFFCLRSISTL